MIIKGSIAFLVNKILFKKDDEEIPVTTEFILCK